MRLASVTTYSFPSSDGTPAASLTTRATERTSAMTPCRTNSVRRRKHTRRGRPPVSPPPLASPPELTQESRVGINASAKVAYRRCISTHSMTIPGTSACFTLDCGSINADATSSTYRLRFSVRMAWLGPSNSLGVGYVPALIFLTKAVHFLRSLFNFFLDCSNFCRSNSKGDDVSPPWRWGSSCPRSSACNRAAAVYESNVVMALSTEASYAD
mmetsp:Transcript_34931/g.75423  ORF Transcript_34931/g.75423 Transcript_34931/m.75423 type:complete len:213 (+) Transcript_34931:2278-2916(+)